MRPIATLPPAFKRYRKAGGAFVFAAFDDAGESEMEAIQAICALLGDDLDVERLRAFGHRRIDEAEFLGDHCDPQTRALIRRGTWQTMDGKELIDPPLRALDGVKIQSGGVGIPLPGQGGQFARAFALPPYSLDARPREIQLLFDEILAHLLPIDAPQRILDWTSPGLAEVSPWFAAGMDWWGAFLFTIHQPDRGRLIAIAASATD
jgi:hypothetical protein